MVEIVSTDAHSCCIVLMMAALCVAYAHADDIEFCVDDVARFVGRSVVEMEEAARNLTAIVDEYTALATSNPLATMPCVIVAGSSSVTESTVPHTIRTVCA